MYYHLHPYWQMKCHSYQICVLDVNLSCPTHILFEPSHTAPFDACPTGNSSMGRQTVEVAPYSGACRTCPYPSHIFPNFHQRVCTNSLHLPVPMLMPRHHLRALQKWQNTMTSAQSPCEAGLGRVAIFQAAERLSQHVAAYGTYAKKNNKSRCPDPSHISVPFPEKPWGPPNSKPNRKREIGQASSIAMDNFPMPWPLGSGPKGQQRLEVKVKGGWKTYMQTCNLNFKFPPHIDVA